MISHTTLAFREAFERLPASVQKEAREAFRLFKSNPRHPGLRFKKVHVSRSIYSVRISLEYRALALVRKDTAVWFWIGSHADYERLLDG